MTAHESDIRALLEERVEASRTKDIGRLMSLCSDDIVHYDAVLPLQFTGRAEVGANVLRWFGGHEGPIGPETHALTVAAVRGASPSRTCSTWSPARAGTDSARPYGCGRARGRGGRTAGG
ncbi:hypothetical protein ACIRFH_20490 [Streptomyces sp. NPDC093586]|uniref:hypothetical protein n=1 Tax=Streptomyces sp. NPDC093586 TaxID=3366042 RepID=UPI003806B46B